MKINHAIVGCGRIAPCHADAFGHAGISIGACYDVVQATAEAFAQRFNIPNVAGGFEELLGRSDIVSVSLCVPHHLHAEMALRALQSGKHVLVEKPPLLNDQDEAQLLAAASASKCVIMPVVQHRFDPLVIEIFSLISSGALGDLRLVNARLECARPPEYYQGSNWRGQWATEGGSVLMNQGFHLLDLLLLLAGQPQSVKADMATFQPSIMETEDTLIATCRLSKGALGSIAITGAAGSQWRTYLEFLGSKGEIAFTIDYPNALPRFRLANKMDHLHWRKRLADACKIPQGAYAPLVDYYGLSHRDQVRAFLDLIEGREPLHAASFTDAVSVVKCANSIYHQARANRPEVTLESVSEGKALNATMSKPPRLVDGIWSQTWEDLRTSDADALRQMVMRGQTSIVSGGLLARFEQRFAAFAGTSHAVALNNGTAALYVALWAVGVRAGDDVLICDYGFHGMAAAVLSLGARMVICDCDPGSLSIDPAEIQRKRTSRTKAVLVHSPWGVPAHFDRIREAAGTLPIVSDASHAHGASFRGKPIAAWADITCFSLGRLKLVSGGELGSAVTDHAELRDRMVLFGHVNRVPQGLQSLSWTGNAIGLKFRPHPAALSLALSQLARIDEKLRLSRATCLRLEEMCAAHDILPQTVPEGSQRSYWKLVLHLGSTWSRAASDVVERRLRSEGIPVEPNHYWPLLQDQPLCDWPDYQQLVTRCETRVAHAVTPRTITVPAPVSLEESAFPRTEEALSKVAAGLRIAP